MKETYAAIQLKKNTKALLLLLGAVLFVSIVSIISLFFNWHTFKISNITVGIISLTFFAMVSIFVKVVYDYIDRKVEKTSKDIESNKKGVDGEALARQVISDTVGTGHRAFFNKDLPTGGDIDCLILGKKGLLLVEVKNLSKKLNLFPFRIKKFNDPREEAIRHARKLREHLVTNGCKKELHIIASVLYINPEVVYSGRQGVFNIVGLDKFASYFNGLPVDVNMSDEDIVQIALLLDKLQ